LAFLPEGVLQSIDVDPDSSHLLWTASTTPGGYPRVSRNGQLVMLARWILEKTVGPCPPKMQASHKCHDWELGCPTGNLVDFDWHRLCCTPGHLAWETARTNILASARTVAHRNASKGVCQQGHALTRRTTDHKGRPIRKCWECPPSVTQLVQLHHDSEINAAYAAVL